MLKVGASFGTGCVSFGVPRPSLPQTGIRARWPFGTRKTGI